MNQKKSILNLLVLVVFAIAVLLVANRWVHKQFMHKSNCSRYGRISAALSEPVDVSFWGSSVCRAGIQPSIISKSLGVSSENFGVNGLYFDQLYHLNQYALKFNNTTICLVLNPYELTFSRDKIAFEDTFIPFGLEDIELEESFKGRNEFPLNLNYLFKLTAKHWKYLFNAPIEIQHCELGYSNKNQSFRSIFNLYKSDREILKGKMKQLFSIVAEVSRSNKLVVVIPPNLTNQQPSYVHEIINELEKRGVSVLNCTNESRFQEKALYADEIHLNREGSVILSEFLANYLKALIRE